MFYFALFRSSITAAFVVPPTIFPASFKQTLLKTKGDKGGRDLIKNNPALVKKIQIKDEKLGFDIDNEEDLKQFYKIINKISY